VPIPAEAPSKAWVWGHSLLGTADSNPARRGGGDVCLSIVGVVCCHVEVPVSGRSLTQRILTECGVSEYDREASIMRSPGSLQAMHHGKITNSTSYFML
jgi:hypothetical protein